MTYKQGDVIPKARLLEMYKEHCEKNNKECDMELFGFWLMGLRQYLEQKAIKDGYSIVLKQSKGDLVILHDNEASAYLHNRFDKHWLRMFMAHQKAQLVNCTNLNTEEKRIHERRLYMQSKVLQGIDKTARKLEVPPHARLTPMPTVPMITDGSDQ